MDLMTEKATTAELPPGTVRLQEHEASATILVPQPSTDVNQPLNWSSRRKVLQMGLLCTYTVLIFAILTVTPPLWQNISDELGISMDDLNYSYATAYAALTVAALIFIPLSIMYGRRPVYLATSVIMLASAIWMAKMQTTFDVIASNFLSGIAGSVNEALFNVTICDLFFVHQRGTVTGIYLLVVTIGTYLAPIASGYIAASQGWRWVFWYCTIFMSVTSMAMFFFLEETKWEPQPAVLLGRPETVSDQPNTETSISKGSMKKIASNGSGLMQIETPLAPTQSTIPHKSYRQRHPWYTASSNPTKKSTFLRILQQLYHPFLILGIFPAVMFSALQYAWSESMLSFLAVTQASIYPLPPYNFSAIGVGNMNIAPAIGCILGSLFGGPLSDYLIIAISRRRNGIYEPEYRLWTYMIPGLSMVAGVLLYGLTIAQGMPWIITAVGAGLIGFGLGGCADMALVYVQDSYDGIIGPALIAVVFIRNGMATVMTFVIPIWMESMGVFNMFVLLGVLTAMVVGTSVLFLVWGKKWRKMYGDRYREMVVVLG